MSKIILLHNIHNFIFIIIEAPIVCVSQRTFHNKQVDNVIKCSRIITFFDCWKIRVEIFTPVFSIYVYNSGVLYWLRLQTTWKRPAFSSHTLKAWECPPQWKIRRFAKVWEFCSEITKRVRGVLFRVSPISISTSGN